MKRIRISSDGIEVSKAVKIMAEETVRVENRASVVIQRDKHSVLRPISHPIYIKD